MTAVNSLQTPAPSGGEPRIYEPSMEEILASIRRIIADDQSLPGRPAQREPEPAPEPQQAAPEPAPTAPVHQAPLHQAPLHVIHAVEKTEEPFAPAPHTVEMNALSEALRPMAHGPIAAPQFASPAGTESKEPETPTVAEQPEPDPEVEDHPAELLQVADFQALSKEAEDAAFEPEAYEEPFREPAPKPREPEPRVETARHPAPAEAPRASETPAALFSHATDHSVTAAFNTLAATRLADNSDELMNLTRDMIRPLLKTWLDENLPSMVERMVRAEIERVARGGR